MSGIINLSDKSLWNVQGSNYGINNINVATLGELNAIMAAAGATIAYGSQDDLGKRVAISEAGAPSYTYTPNGTLYGGVYQMVQLSSAATAGNVAVGLVAYMLASGASGYVVTDEAHADSTALFAGIFLNTVTPGNYCAICVGGKVNAAFKNPITNGAPAIGDNVVAGGGTGHVDDASAQTVAPTGLAIGKAVAAPASGVTSIIRIHDAFIGRY